MWYKSTYIWNLGKLYRNGDAEVNKGLLDITGKDRVGRIDRVVLTYMH